MSEFNYFKSNRVYNDIYFQYPKVFIYGEKYKSLSEGAKLAYMLLKHELTKAIEKEQVDDEGYIYFEMTVSYLATLMNCSERKVVRVKNELEKADLLKQIKMGFNTKTGKNNPNRLYLAELDVTDQDVYLMKKNAQSLDTSGSDKMTGCSQNPKTDETLDTSGSDKMAGCPENAQSLDTSGSDKMAENVYKYNYLDTNRHNIDSTENSQQDQLLLENFVALIKEKAAWVPEIVLNLIQTYSTDYQVALETLYTIQKAKHIAERETRSKIMYEEVPNYVENPDHSLYTTIQKAYLKQKTEKVDNLQSLIFIYVKNWFIEKPIFIKNQLEKQEYLPPIEPNFDYWQQ